MSDFWLDLGFTQNPYAVKPLPSNEEGRRLLVGRDSELNNLVRRIQNSDLHPVLEGPNGVGKTSLVSVAAYVLTEAYRDRLTQQLFLPLIEPLQMKDDGAALIQDIYFALAQAFIHHHDVLRSAGRAVPDLRQLQQWMNSPTYGSSRSAGISTPIGGFSSGRGSSLNTSPGYTLSGLHANLRKWLRECFPEGSGGFVGTLDNLELLETSSEAQSVLEQLRDPVLQLGGTRWVLCGARGIARSLATTPRLNGVLSDPVEVRPVDDDFIESVIDARVAVFSLDEYRPANAPVSAAGFRYLYEVSHQNLRDSFRYAQDFALDSDASSFQRSEAQTLARLVEWVDRLAERSAADVRLQQRMWKLLDDLAERGGSASPSEYAEYGFTDRTHMRKNVVELERYALANSSRDDADGRRRSIALTSKGWLVQFAKQHELLGQAALDLRYEESN